MKQLSPSQLRMTVLIIMAVFLLSSLIACICLYFKANQISDDAKILNKAVMEATSIAETLKACDGKMNKTARMLKGHKIYSSSKDSLIFYYDENMDASSQTSSSYTASVKKERSDNCRLYSISIYHNSDNSSIYELSFKAPMERK